jgi:hypothetical protein
MFSLPKDRYKAISLISVECNFYTGLFQGQAKILQKLKKGPSQKSKLPKDILRNKFNIVCLCYP